MALLVAERVTKYIAKIILMKYINQNMEIVGYGLMVIILKYIK